MKICYYGVMAEITISANFPSNLRDQQILTPPCEWGWVVVVPLLGMTLEVEDSPGMVWAVHFTISIPTIFPILSLYEEMLRRRHHLGEGEEEEQNCDYPRWHNREEYGSIEFFLKEMFCFEVLLLLFSPIMYIFLHVFKILWKNIMKNYCDNFSLIDKLFEFN